MGSKSIFKSRTVWVNLGLATVSFGTYLQGSELLASKPEVVALIGAGIGIVNILLRLITKQPITK